MTELTDEAVKALLDRYDLPTDCDCDDDDCVKCSHYPTLQERASKQLKDAAPGLARALLAAAPDLYDGGEEQTIILRRAQAILTQYLIPDGIDAPEAINQLLGLLDGPDQREAQSAWDAAIAKARGEA